MNKISNYHHIYSSVGGANIGQSVKFRDELLHPNLEAAGWFDVYVYGITGKRFKPDSITLLEAIWVCTSYPDPRIWNNRVACIVGGTRGTAGLAVSSALAV